MTHFKAALMNISLRKKLHYYPSSIITHKNLSTTPFITCNTCYSFSCFICICLCHIVLSVSCSHVVTRWERADLLALLHVTFSCVFVTPQYGERIQIPQKLVPSETLCWHPDGGQYIECNWLGSVVIIQGIRTSIAKKFYIL